MNGSSLAGYCVGILSSLLKIIMGDFKQGSDVIIAAIECWTDLLTLVIGDHTLPSSTLTAAKSSVTNSTTNSSVVVVADRAAVESQLNALHALVKRKPTSSSSSNDDEREKRRRMQAEEQARNPYQ
jgi:hypothetical protein